MKTTDIAIVGAGTAGLSARNAVAKHTDDYLVIDSGPLGTLCARSGCMPSKALIHAANRVHEMADPPPGVCHGMPPKADTAKVLAHVRALRDEFVQAVLEDMESWQQKHLVCRRASLKDAHTLDLEGETVRARRIIIATGSRPVMPQAWQAHARFLLDSDSLFEQKQLPPSMAVIGLGPLGVELALAMQRLGVEVNAIDPQTRIGGLSDPVLTEYVADWLGEQMTVCFEQAELHPSDGQKLKVSAGEQRFEVDQALVAVGRKPVVQGLGLENLGVKLNDQGLPEINPETLQVGDLPVFMAGDVNGQRPVLHEAASEGRIAGKNALQSSPQAHERLTPLNITFTSPQMAVAGQGYRALQQAETDFVCGQVSYERQGRARIMQCNTGLLRLYAARSDGRLLGAELFAPGGEHLAHLLAWSIAQKASVTSLLGMPFYHPVLEEGLRTAVGDAVKKLKS